MKRELTQRQKNFINLVNEGENPVDAALDAYKCKSRAVAKVISSRNLSHPVITQKVRDILEYPGSKARAEYVAKTIEQSLYAEKPHILKDGTVLMTPDHKVRLAAATLILKMRGEMKEEVINNVPKDIKVSFTLVKARSDEEVRKYLPYEETRLLPNGESC